MTSCKLEITVTVEAVPDTADQLSVAAKTRVTLNGQLVGRISRLRVDCGSGVPSVEIVPVDSPILDQQEAVFEALRRVPGVRVLPSEPG